MPIDFNALNKAAGVGAEAPAQVASPQSQESFGTGVARFLGGTVLRAGLPTAAGTLGALAGPAAPVAIPALAAAGGALGELLAERYVDAGNGEINPGRVAVNAGLSAIPGAWMIKSGKPALSAALSGGLGYLGVAGNKMAEGVKPEDALNPLSKEWHGMDYALGPLAGAGLGAVIGHYSPVVKPPTEAPKPNPLESAKGLRVKVDELQSAPPNSPGLKDTHAALEEHTKKFPSGEVAVKIWGKSGRPGEPSVVDFANAEEEASKLRTKTYDANQKAQGGLTLAQQQELKDKAPLIKLVQAAAKRELTPEEHALLDHEVQTFPKGVVARLLGTNKPSMREGQIQAATKAESAAAKMNANEAASDVQINESGLKDQKQNQEQVIKDLNAGFKANAEATQGLAKAEEVTKKATDRAWEQEAKNMTHAERMNKQIERQREIDSFKAQKDVEPVSEVARENIKGDEGESLTRTFAKVIDDKNKGGNGGGGVDPNAPLPQSDLGDNLSGAEGFSNIKAAQTAVKRLGLSGSVDIVRRTRPDGKVRLFLKPKVDQDVNFTGLKVPDNPVDRVQPSVENPLAPFKKLPQDINAERLTPEVRAELEAMANHIEATPFENNRWDFSPHDEAGVANGNAAGGQANIGGGHAGSPETGAVLGEAPLNKGGKTKNGTINEVSNGNNGSHAKVAADIRKMLESNDIHNNVAEGAVRLAEKRVAANKFHDEYGVGESMWNSELEGLPKDYTGLKAKFDELMDGEDTPFNRKMAEELSKRLEGMTPELPADVMQGATVKVGGKKTGKAKAEVKPRSLAEIAPENPDMDHVMERLYGEDTQLPIDKSRGELPAEPPAPPVRPPEEPPAAPIPVKPKPKPKAPSGLRVATENKPTIETPAQAKSEKVIARSPNGDITNDGDFVLWRAMGMGSDNRIPTNAELSDVRQIWDKATGPNPKGRGNVPAQIAAQREIMNKYASPEELANFDRSVQTAIDRASSKKALTDGDKVNIAAWQESLKNSKTKALGENAPAELAKAIDQAAKANPVAPLPEQGLTLTPTEAKAKQAPLIETGKPKTVKPTAPADTPLLTPEAEKLAEANGVVPPEPPADSFARRRAAAPKIKKEQEARIKALQSKVAKAVEKREAETPVKTPLDTTPKLVKPSGEKISPVEQPTPTSGLRVFKSPLEAAKTGYGEIKDAVKAGEAVPKEAPRVAGSAVSRLKREAGELPPAKTHNGKPIEPQAEAATPAMDQSQIEAGALDALDDPNIPQTVKDRIKRNLQKGEINPMPLFRLGGAAVGGAIGATQTPDDPMKGALIGAGAGALAPSAARAMINALRSNPRATPEEIQTTGEKIKQTALEYAKFLPDYQRFALLSNIPNLAVNVFVGPWGSGLMHSMELMLQRDKRGFALFKDLWNPFKKFVPGVLNSKAQAAELLHHDASEGFRAEMTGGSTSIPEGIRNVVSAPGQAMVAGDLAIRNIMAEHGLSIPEARRATLTSEPTWAISKKIAAFKKGKDDNKSAGIVGDLMLPFYRTNLNQVEQSVQRIPVIGHFAQSWGRSPDPVKSQIAQQAFGGSLGAIAFIAGAAIPAPANQNDPGYRFVKKFISDFSGPYGAIVNTAFMAGQAYSKGKDAAGILRTGIGGAVNNMPTPGFQPITEGFYKAVDMATGKEGKPGKLPFPSTLVPGFLKPDTMLGLPQILGILSGGKAAPAGKSGLRLSPPRAGKLRNGK